LRQTKLAVLLPKRRVGTCQLRNDAPERGFAGHDCLEQLRVAAAEGIGPGVVLLRLLGL
jgi:hypothetical protein